MIDAVLAELQSSAQADLPAKLAAVAARTGVALVTAFQLRTWWDDERQDNLDFGAESDAIRALLAVLWSAPSTTGLAKSSAGVRDSEHPITLRFVVIGADDALMQRHLTLLPEAALAWLDAFPIASRVPGKTITKINAPDGQGIRVTPQINVRRGEKEHARTIAAVDLAITVRARDALS